MKTRLDRWLLTALVVSAFATAAAAALAASPIKGAKYQGKISHTSSITFPISFKVSATGKQVSSFKLPHGYPTYCQGGGFGTVQPASGVITKQGTFKVMLPIYFAPAHSHQGSVIITGTFAKHGKESGKITTDFTHASKCNGTSSYTTKG